MMPHDLMSQVCQCHMMCQCWSECVLRQQLVLMELFWSTLRWNMYLLSLVRLRSCYIIQPHWRIYLMTTWPKSVRSSMYNPCSLESLRGNLCMWVKNLPGLPILGTTKRLVECSVSTDHVSFEPWSRLFTHENFPLYVTSFAPIPYV